MGGDDLGSDDEFLTGQVVDDEDDRFDFGQEKKKKQSVLAASTVAVIEDDDGGEDFGNEKKNKKKRKKGSAEEEEEEAPNSNKKSKTGKPSRQKLLVTAGRALELESTENQSTFLWTCLVHHHQMKSGKEGDDEEEATAVLQPKLQPFHFIPPSSTSSSFETRLRHCLPSMKQLKTWKHRQSPLAIIVCLSARRAVQILKEIKSLKTRAAKLFAKHLTVQEQTTWLQQTPFGLAVGTPHRLNVLCKTPQSLSLQHTKLIVLDAHADPKGFTVCTLPDTAPQCMEFLRDQVLPALKERPKQIKLAFC